jgi:hypothetical protein
MVKNLRLPNIAMTKITFANRSVYAIGFPHRENLPAKEDRKVVGGTGRPGFRLGPPAGVTVFANAINK